MVNSFNRSIICAQQTFMPIQGPVCNGCNIVDIMLPATFCIGAYVTYIHINNHYSWM